MDKQRWRQVETLYQAALEREPGVRGTFLAQACAGDEELRREVEELLRSDGTAGSSLRDNALVVAEQGLAAGELTQTTPELLPGQGIGAYKILALLGRGGMGVVYRARDERLRRDVAIKVLPASFAQDADRLHRFEQEAQATSALNHPNILTIYGIGTHEGAPFIVAELLEGEELQAQLESGALPVRRALEYAQQITAGLAAAHAKGIVHRDLKPENLFVTKDGRVKILDFGLAKLKPPQIGGADGEAPTLKKITDPGTVIGTVGYMAPEQVRGQEADHRSDIFSFGVILYEMLSGRRAFSGESAIEVMNAILKEDPPELTAANPRVPQGLERLIRRCLEKKPERRFHSAHDLGYALEELSSSLGARLETQAALPVVIEGEGPWRLFGQARLAWLVGVALLLGMLGFAWAYFTRQRTTNDAQVTKLSLLPPVRSSFGHIAVSPDGRRLAFVATTAEGRKLLWVRSLDALSAQPLTGTEGASFPFWSPESRFLGFFADGKLKKIEAAGGPPLTLCDAPQGRGGTWNRGGVIVFAPFSSGTLHQVSASGGTASAVTQLDEARGETTHRWPCFLPDGQHFLYLGRATTTSESEMGAIYIASLESKTSKLLLHANSSVVYTQGYLLYLLEETPECCASLLAQPFDTKRLETMGDASPIAEQVQYEPFFFRGAFSVSENGVLAYQTGAEMSSSQLAWFDRSGKQLDVLGDLARYANPRLSPDGKRVAVIITDPQTRTRDIWLYEVARGLGTRFTFDPAEERAVTWSSDGSRIVFASDRKVHFDLYQKASSGASSEELLLDSNLDKYPTSWSPDGRFLLYHTNDPKTRPDLWILPLMGDQKPFPFLQTEFSEDFGQFSPDGRWIAYNSDESRSTKIYVMPFPGPGGKRQVSTSGGRLPKWRGDGGEIFYLAPDNKLIAAEVNGRGATLEVGAVRVLFEIPLAGRGYVYDVTADGQRFLINTAVEKRASAPITLVLNWTADLKR